MQESKTKSGFTLVEAMFALLILGIAAAGLIKILMSVQYSAQNNLYESIAMTVALSTLEQMKSKDFDTLEKMESEDDPTFNLIRGNGSVVSLALNSETEIEVPIAADEAGDITKELTLTLTPSITAIDAIDGFWLEVDYSYNHPRNNRIYSGTVRNMRSDIQTL